MRLETIALNNLKRRKGRMAFLVIGLLIGIATVVCLLSLSEAMTAEAQHKMENFGANILITPRTDELSLSYGGISLGGISIDPVEIREADLHKLHGIPNHRNIAAVAPKVLGAVKVGEGRVLLMGVDPEKEFLLKRWWSLAGRPIEKGDELVAGSAAAARLGLNMGDTVDLNGRSFTLVGIIAETGSQDDQLLISDLAVAQQLLHKEGRLSLVEVAALCADCPVEDMVHQIQAVLPEAKVGALQQVVKTRMHAIEQFQAFSMAVAAVVVVIGALVVFVTMMGSVNERTREIGIFRALGFRRSHVMRLILLESSVVSLLAGVLGYLVGMGTTMLVLPLLAGSEGMVHGAGHGAESSALAFDPLLAVAAVVLALVVGALASFYPALHASRMDPTEALRAL